MKATILNPALEGVKVRHIASSPLVTRELGVDSEEIDRDESLAEFDQIPLTHDGRIVSVFEREKISGGKNVIRDLHGGMFVGAELPAIQVLRGLGEHHYFLVVDGTEVAGIVALSDLNKIGMRSLFFGLFTAYEQALADAIAKIDQGQWERYLRPNQLKRFKERVEAHHKNNTWIDPVHLTDLAHKHRIVSKHFQLGNRFDKLASELKELRNDVAHCKPLSAEIGKLKSHARLALLLPHLTDSFRDACDGGGIADLIK